MARGSCPSVREPSRWRRPDCSTVAAPPRTGTRHRGWPKQHASVDVDAHALYVQDGAIFTSAGLASGIDLCLRLVRLDYGAEVANVAARRMVAAPHRSGGQARFIERPVSVAADQGLDGTREWILRNLERPLALADMAAHAHRSTRSCSRHFVAETGLSPLQWLVDQRVRAAQTLLEAGDLDVEAIARACGFGSAVSLRQLFRKIVGTTPMAYRRSFLAPASAPRPLGATCEPR